MKKTFLIPTIIALVALALASFSVALISSTLVHANSTKTIHVIEHLTDVAIGDVPPAGDSAGDQLVFHNPLFYAADKHQVGQTNGDCVRTVPGQNGVYECFLTVFLSAGQLTLEGPFYSSGADSLLAITGGTGAYQEARGQARIHATGHPVGSEYDFFLTLVD
jgi:allene oxide cyclase